MSTNLIHFSRRKKKWYQNEYNLKLIKNHILYCPTISTSIAILIENFTNEKEGIIVQPPVFMEFKDTIRKTHRSIIKNPLKLSDNYYELDFNDLFEKTKSSNNKVLILCNPHNPVGRVWKKSELKEIVRICKLNEVLIISDEIHKDIILFNNHFTSLLEFKNTYDKIVVCTSEAKSFNLCGIADSMVIIPNDEIRASVSKTLKKYNLGRTNALTRIALECAYQEGGQWLKNVIKIIESNVTIIEEGLIDSKIKLIKPEGTYQVWLDFRSVFDDTKIMFNHLVDHTGIAMNAGHWFGREGA